MMSSSTKKNPLEETKNPLEARYRRVAEILVREHARRQDEPLVLAIQYRLNDQNFIHLLEVVDNFPGNPEDELFEIESTLSSPELAIPGKLHLILASPAQLSTALARKDPLLRPLKTQPIARLFPPLLKSRSPAAKLIDAINNY